MVDIRATGQFGKNHNPQAPTRQCEQPHSPSLVTAYPTEAPQATEETEGSLEMRVGMLFSSAPSPRPSRPYSARPRLYAFPVGGGREMSSSRERVPGWPGEFPYPWELVPIPRVVRRKSSVSLPVLGEAWENLHRAPLNSYLKSTRTLGGGCDPHRPTFSPTHEADPGSKSHGLRSQARPVPRDQGTPDPKVPPSESMQTVWCWPPEKPTQDLVEFLKDVRFWGTKQDSVPGVPGRQGQERVVRGG